MSLNIFVYRMIRFLRQTIENIKVLSMITIIVFQLIKDYIEILVQISPEPIGKSKLLRKIPAIKSFANQSTLLTLLDH